MWVIHVVAYNENITGSDSAVMCNLIDTHTHTNGNGSSSGDGNGDEDGDGDGIGEGVGDAKERKKPHKSC